MASLLERLDSQLEELLNGWNFLTTIIALLLLIYLIYPIVTAAEPDTHPLLLSRQTNVSAVRQPGQSAIYRSSDMPHGHPLTSGLNIREPGAARWAGGKDGDVRDIWRQAVKGKVDESGNSAGGTGKILTLRGTEQMIEHDFSTVSRDINVIGSYIKRKGATCVAIYLPNSVELLVTAFAAAFYGFHPVFIPYDKPKDIVLKLFQIAKVDFIVAAAGSLPAGEINSTCRDVIEVMWVVEETSREVDWTDASDATSSWHEVIEENGNETSADLPASKPDDQVLDFVTFWLGESPKSGELVAFTQKNIVAAVGAQVSSLPTKHRLGPGDIFLPAESLTASYMLISTLAALFSNATVALNSQAGSDVPLSTVAQGIAPTVVAITSTQAFNLHDSTKDLVNSAAKKYALSAQNTALSTGVLPTTSLATRFTTPITANIGNDIGRLRLVYVFDRAHSESPPASSARLSDLRAFTGARLIHALTAAKVAGPVAQTHLFDYRKADNVKTPAHFGVPPTCLELVLKDKEEYSTTDEKASGEITVRGPAVLNGEADLGIYAQIRDDGCLEYLYQYPESATRPTTT